MYQYWIIRMDKVHPKGDARDSGYLMSIGRGGKFKVATYWEMAKRFENKNEADKIAASFINNSKFNAVVEPCRSSTIPQVE